jgi:hypothetical protein
MSDTPTDVQISDLRADIGDQDATAFTDDEITRIWYRMRGASSEVQQHEATLAMMARQLMTQAAKLVNYRAGAISENRGDVIKNLERIYNLFKPSLEAVQGTSRQFAQTTIRGKPRQGRTFPDGRSDHAEPG